MVEPSKIPPPPSDSTYVAHLWDYPHLTLAVFGMQYLNQEAYALYEAAGIPAQMDAYMSNFEGLLCTRSYESGTDHILFQYWRSHEDLARFAREFPHTTWWKWLMANRGKGFGFYHEIYQCKTAEAIYEVGSQPVGPAAFCLTSAVDKGQGRSAQRQARFIEAGK